MPIKVQGVNSSRIIMRWRNNIEYEAAQRNLAVSLHSFPALSSCHLLWQELLSHAGVGTRNKKQNTFCARVIDADMGRKMKTGRKRYWVKINEVQSIDLYSKWVFDSNAV